MYFKVHALKLVHRCSAEQFKASENVAGLLIMSNRPTSDQILMNSL